MAVITYQAHEDSINSMTLINDPFSYISCSKDKKVRIWSFDNQLLGEIDTRISFSQNDRRVFDWKFKVDWEKLKEKEFNEVINIYEEIGGEEVKFDEGKLLELDVKMKNESKFNRENKVKDHKITQIERDRRRFKPIEEKRKKIEEKQDDNENSTNIDDQSLKEIHKDIKKILLPAYNNIGLVEIVKTVIDTDGNKQTEHKKEEQGKENDILDKKIKNNINEIQPMTNNKLSNKIKKNNLNTEKLKKPNENKQEKKEKQEMEEKNRTVNHKSLILPQISSKEGKNKYLNVKFNKGETERILSYEQYKSSYDTCCLVGKRGVTNNTLKTNFNMMWKYVKDYSDLINSQKLK